MADLARSHGGDGAGEDPPGNSYKPPSGCESSQSKKKRGANRNQKLFKKIDQQKSRLSIKFDLSGKQVKAIGENYSHWIRAIGTMVGAGGFHYANWNKVPKEHHADLLQFLEEHFDLESHKTSPDWPWILQGITADCKARFSGRKNKFKTEFDMAGGYANEEMARQNCPKTIEQDMWDALIDHFGTDEYKKRSNANTNNRSRLKYPSLHGSRSYAQGRNLPGEETGYIDHWFKMHCKNGIWVDVEAEADWGIIQQELHRMKTVAGEGGEHVDEIQCLRNALGERRGHSRGVGRQVKQPSPFDYLSNCGSSSQATRLAQVEEELQQVREEVNQIKKKQRTNQDDEDEGQRDDS